MEIRVPQLGESVVEATVGKWRKAPGDTVTLGEPLVELETEKVNLEIAAEQAGVLARIDRQTGENVRVGDVLGTVEEQGAARPAPAQEAVAANQEAATESAATPVARRLAEERAIDLTQVTGSGPGGRITQDDVRRYLEQQAAPQPAAAPVPAPPPAPAAPPAPRVAPAPAPIPPQAPTAPVTGERREERVRMSRRRQTIARRLVEVQHTAAMLTTFNEVDMSAIMDVRRKRRESFRERHGIGLGFMSFFTKAVVGALKAFPMVNAELQGDEVVMKRYYDIGIAIATDEGLVVPVVRDADRLTFAEIERQIDDLARRARTGGLTLPELQGGTFTITNGGVFGSLLSTPILNSPQVGILGMHKIEERPVVMKGEIVARPMMYLALSYDHRVIDGSEAVRFLVRIKELLEDPETLLLEG